MKAKKAKIFKFKMGELAVSYLRKKGGFHSTEKGEHGYNRRNEKKEVSRLLTSY